ncbi:hypothetical protein GCK72_012170 [Caenorhabditis remanei]|uniref:Uncharacterized protein n=1 Tax=Caenorhabditis remanei TaxID=31234 RepID=A0A6A5GKB0_CAERE|nr:hypothetical protein GCK72_012170 [Caenorhabditis remanei]KAF1755720.1 hypothetical protein GCK72_012170 [Caenorhabditis remanei]
MRSSIILLLFFCVQCVSPAPVKVKREVSDTDRKTVLDLINNERRKIAQHLMIANMNELAYDVGFEKIAEGMTCQTQANGANYMVASFPDDTGLKKILEVPRTQQEEASKNLMGGMLIPDQTKFSCVGLEEPCTGPGGTIRVRCVIGPKTVFQTWDFKKGVAGSQCPSDREAADGLCKAKNGAECLSGNVITSSIIVFLISLYVFLQ